MAKMVPEQIYQIKVTLQNSKPPIWRRLLVPGSMTLDELHRVLQAAMGWTDSHLHQFNVHGERYGPANLGFNDDFDDEQSDEARVQLDQVLAQPKSSMTYEYDFGDDWVHKIVLEKIVDPAPGLTYPNCVAGARACPPEDCGGIWGYASLLDALKDPAHPEHESMCEWIGEDFDPENFHVAETNKCLAELGLATSMPA